RYRNKAIYQFAEIGGRLTAGFYARHSHRVVPCGDCPLHPEAFGKILKKVIYHAEKQNVSAYDEQTGKGVLRRLYLRSTAAGDVMLCVVCSKPTPQVKQLCASMLGFERTVSCYINVCNKPGNAVLSDKMLHIAGVAKLEDVLCGKRFLLSPASFYQVNHDGAELLYSTVRSLAGEAESILDMYCGTGTIGICCASGGTSLTGFDVNADATDDARLNAGANGLDNALFICADAEEFAKKHDTKSAFDVVIMDPPRKGSTPEVVGLACRCAKEKIVYVSCDPATLARDCALFIKLGWRIDRSVPVDMFPRTANIETVVSLVRATPDIRRAF
ncbi:MAG: 23S rRNA (uracil(1939)-C(5))-methyltransferase RlmD, partial [Clostridia bacterium]|nr:23S rRNA (uracil(1939)-C(5))-methyltransferase RlmD [Clostridia bacterium]